MIALLQIIAGLIPWLGRLFPPKAEAFIRDNVRWIGEARARQALRRQLNEQNSSRPNDPA